MKLYFQNSQGKERVIAEVNDKKEALDEIYKFCKERNFEVYYVRCWQVPNGRLKFDCGSHSEFFYLDISDEITE
jgi:hypothetical protein